MQSKVDENHKRYLERIKLFKNFGYDVEKERKFIFDKAKPISGSILEVGTGKGHFALELAKAGYFFISIDMSEEEQEFARLNIENLGLSEQVNFGIENAESLSFRDGSFDIILSINTIHHLDNPFKVLDELTRVVTRTGKIVLSDFNKKGFEIMDRIHASEHRKHKSGVSDLQEIKVYFQDKGLRIEEFSSEFQDVLIAYRK